MFLCFTMQATHHIKWSVILYSEITCFFVFVVIYGESVKQFYKKKNNYFLHFYSFECTAWVLNIWWNDFIINLFLLPIFTQLSYSVVVFLSCRPFVITIFSTVLFGCWSFFCLLAWAVHSWSYIKMIYSVNYPLIKD